MDHPRIMIPAPGQASDHKEQRPLKIVLLSYRCRKNCQSTKDMAVRRHLLVCAKGNNAYYLTTQQPDNPIQLRQGCLKQPRMPSNASSVE
ncbi:hypothetical protein [Nitrosomonas communis]|uniref:hypothetical protein n=1 Tax=Nitrosomonas communis TaxID=44574 RepID=UPI003D2B104D